MTVGRATPVCRHRVPPEPAAEELGWARPPRSWTESILAGPASGGCGRTVRCAADGPLRLLARRRAIARPLTALRRLPGVTWD